MKERKKVNPIINKEETMESFIKDSIIMNKEVNLLNIFESIHELQRMILIKTNKLFVNKETGILMSLSKYKRVIREEMQKMNIPSTIALGYYSQTASIEEAIVILIEKDIEPQKEKVEKLITFEKEKFEENIEMTDEDIEYDKEMFKNEEIEELVRKEEIEQKEKDF
jgi:hypothetical protein